MNATIVRKSANGNIWQCDHCGEEFEVTWARNPCQCEGCAGDNDHVCDEFESKEDAHNHGVY